MAQARTHDCGGADRIGDTDPHSVSFVIRIALWPDVQDRAAQTCTHDTCLVSCSSSGPDVVLLDGERMRHLVSAAVARLAMALASDWVATATATATIPSSRHFTTGGEVLHAIVEGLHPVQTPCPFQSRLPQQVLGNAAEHILEANRKPMGGTAVVLVLTDSTRGQRKYAWSSQAFM